ncbi:unnamed protein product [Anisakis simplex]|uniref:Properdin (inferred by orthology to a human protein) n=1 Tax=Anisakis simplex TaxID=6269 RepID=A0A0M3J2Q2_ANISI|nr:unnamed protein product [Anisakis simplex]
MRWDEKDTQQCDIRACAQWTPWGDWSTCDKDCGPGKKTRRRECVTSEGDASSRCEGDAVDHSVCLVQACCQWTTWNDWSSCDRDCGGGRLTRSRMCLRPGTDDSSGCDCAGYDREQMSCNEHHCAPIPYEYEAEPEFPPESVYQPQPVTQPQLQPLPLTTIAPTHLGTQPAVIRKQLIHHHRPTPVYKPGPVIIPVRVPYYIKPVTRTEVGSTAATTGLSCQWSEWWGWNQHAGGDLRRSRACIGDNDCVCYGPAVQEAVCSECAENVECVEACKKK